MRGSIYISSHCHRRRPPSDTLTRVRSVRGVTWFGWASQGLGSSAPSTLGRRGSRAGTWSASPPRARSDPSGRRSSSAPIARSSRPRRSPPRTDVDVVHICTPNHLHAPLAETALGRRQARGLREAAGDRCRAGAPLDRCGDRGGPPGGGPVRLPVLPDRARGARARPRRGRPARCGSSTARTCRTGCSARRTTTGASTSTPGARRGRSPTSARTGATSPSSSAVSASRGSAGA